MCPDMTIEAYRAYRLMERAATRSGFTDFGLRLAVWARWG